MSFGVIAVSLVIIVITIYLVVYVIYPSPSIQEILSTLTPLNDKKDVVMPVVSQKTLLTTNGGTVMGMFYFQPGDRTANYTTRFLPFVQIANNWYLEVSNAPNDKKQAAARLRVRTTQKDAGYGDEMIDLPPIPKQKWIFIAVLRDGRRFDVVYDDKIVASQRLEHYPAVISSPVSIGSKGLSGSVIHLMISASRQSTADLERTRKSLVDTNQIIVEDNPIIGSLPTASLSAQCPPGLPCKAVSRPPINQRLQWNTPFA